MSTRAKGVFSDPVRLIAGRLGQFLREKGLIAEATRYLLKDPTEFRDHIEHFCGMFHLSDLIEPAPTAPKVEAQPKVVSLPKVQTAPKAEAPPSKVELKPNISTLVGNLPPSKVQTTPKVEPTPQKPSKNVQEQQLPPLAEAAITTCEPAPVALAQLRSQLLNEFQELPLYKDNFQENHFFLRRVSAIVGGKVKTLVAVGTGRAIHRDCVVNINCAIAGKTTAQLNPDFFPDEDKSPLFHEANGVKRWVWILDLTPGIDIRLWVNKNNGERGQDVFKATFAVTTTGFRLVTKTKTN